MTLKEKLAYEFVRDQLIKGTIRDVAIYVLGFKKAREMALAEYSKTTCTPFVERIEKLGEEEVDVL